MTKVYGRGRRKGTSLTGGGKRHGFDGGREGGKLSLKKKGKLNLKNKRATEDGGKT